MAAAAAAAAAAKATAAITHLHTALLLTCPKYKRELALAIV
jgi:hypothetical protein